MRVEWREIWRDIYRDRWDLYAGIDGWIYTRIDRGIYARVEVEG